ncbi:hypothetical protein NDA11_004860 [Ustilago hordei]|uniref:Reverse transcriptase Ty1/copia-type domain-containing protein n=1 Tax=Ustilago hordei TaxID=120017 RepID=I2G5H2_USTHO|nr:uncharacterized protein UHO2_01845 [Ustilago hordei]KAJ1039288.1 hypothetical protein NDA10_003139 [Ustilago hordei]KAJ1585866.1 hypothetical protein NDA12_002646 [Ustilago hordei]KAJ1588899.1 hypothetical protein NDA15_000220 [Ustilago hordei]KAJ1590991.1 hypothetical protein NDA11_004860 [Ustilago hordei]KAJ1600856.1 hypothetical protein NDA14_004417 [Ustilago hordei]
MITIGNLKPTVREALNGPDQTHWHKAICTEMEGLESMNIWKVVDMPTNAHLVDLKLVLNVKMDANGVPYKFKAQSCAQGFSQREGVDYMEIFAPIVPHDTIHTVLVIAAKFNWEIDTIDIKQAYLNASLSHDIYLKAPEGVNIAPGKVYKLLKSLYGLKQSKCKWHKELDSHLWYLGFFPSQAVPCVYLKGTGDDQVIITVYVDDMLIAAPRQHQINAVKQVIIKKWQIEDNGPVMEFLKIKIMHNQKDRTIDLDQ